MVNPHKKRGVIFIRRVKGLPASFSLLSFPFFPLFSLFSPFSFFLFFYYERIQTRKKCHTYPLLTYFPTYQYLATWNSIYVFQQPLVAVATFCILLPFYSQLQQHAAVKCCSTVLYPSYLFILSTSLHSNSNSNNGRGSGVC